MENEKFCLRWNDFETNISSAFRALREDKDLFDVTLVCDDEQIQSHKVILSACSPFFRKILCRNPHQHPLLYLKGVNCSDLQSVLNFMYHGEVNVAQEELNSFLAVAEDLKVKGLTQNNSDSKATNSQQSGSYKPRVRNIPDQTEPLPPPKRPRPTPPRPTPPPVSKAHSGSYYPDDNDIQEVVPVKSEPVPLPPDTQPHSTPMALIDQAYSTPQEDQITTGVVSDPNIEYEEEYADYGGYDGAGGSFDAGLIDASGMTVRGQDGNKDVESLVKSFMKKTVDEVNKTVWECVQCGKVSKFSTNIKDHIEANHIEGMQFECHYCLKIFKSRPSLRTHTRMHKTHPLNDNLS
eukprot:GFUD01036693.1.p1 GENE.GFUD01036693.1~~GFUD01036693.1.p1  ORF type:complete len:350 (+),score=84.02 GFUD01036693.1:85-1134(+)